MEHESFMVGCSTEGMVGRGTKGNIHLQYIVKP